MELQGRVIAETPERSGTSARGEWKAKDYVIETHDAYPKKLAFSVFGDERLQRFNIKIGDEITVFFDIDAREYQGKWFNSVRAFDVRHVDLNATGAPVDNTQPMGQPTNPIVEAQTPFPPQPEVSGDGTADDLPF